MEGPVGFLDPGGRNEPFGNRMERITNCIAMKTHQSAQLALWLEGRSDSSTHGGMGHSVWGKRLS
jgi:hypothetical protein